MAQQETLNLISSYLEHFVYLEEAAKTAHAEADEFFSVLTNNQILAEHDARMLVYGDYQGTLVKIEKLAHKMGRKLQDM